MRKVEFLLLGVVLAFTLVACGQDSAPSHTAESLKLLTGQVSYEGSIDPPAGSVLTVILADVSLQDVASVELARDELTDLAQGPYLFTLRYDPQQINPSMSYAVRAQIRHPEQGLLWTTTQHYGVLTRGQPSDQLSLKLSAVGAMKADLTDAKTAQRVHDFKPQEVGKTLVYQCGEARITVKTGPGEIAFYRGSEYVILSQVRAASGSKFQEGDLVFWLHGDEAMLIDANLKQSCQQDFAAAPWEKARLKGVTFRAVGQEPSWVLEVSQDQLLMLTDLGQKRHVTPLPEAVVDGAMTHYMAKTEATTLAVEIIETTCNDSMSGDVFDTQVKVSLNSRDYFGCGHFLSR